MDGGAWYATVHGVAKSDTTEQLHFLEPGNGHCWAQVPQLLKPVCPRACASQQKKPPQWEAAAAAAKLLQLCPTLSNPIDGSPLGSPVPGILQARTLEWVVISCFNAWKWKVKVKSLSATPWIPWTAAYQAPPSMGFSRQEYWSGLPLPSPEKHLHWNK